MPQPTLFTEEFTMVRIQSMLALLVCALVPLGALGGQPASTGSARPVARQDSVRR